MLIVNLEFFCKSLQVPIGPSPSPPVYEWKVSAGCGKACRCNREKGWVQTLSMAEDELVSFLEPQCPLIIN